jgi:hypothetical protein
MNPLTVSPLGLRALYLNLNVLFLRPQKITLRAAAGKTVLRQPGFPTPSGSGTRGFGSLPLDGFAFNFLQQHLGLMFSLLLHDKKRKRKSQYAALSC